MLDAVSSEDSMLYYVLNQLNEHWLGSFLLNILTYSTILVPLYLTILLVKRKPSIVQTASVIGFCLQQCVFGKQQEVDLNEAKMEEGISTDINNNNNNNNDNDNDNDNNNNNNNNNDNNNTSYVIKLLWCGAGLQISYLTWGVLQERVMTIEYGGDRFKHSQFLVFTNRILAVLISGLLITCRAGRNNRTPLYKYSYPSFSNILSSWCQYEALKFVSFPTLVLSKASKSIPVMLMGKLVLNKTYPYYEYAFAILLSIGVSLFVLESKSGEGDGGFVQETTLAGVIIIIGYLAFDSFTSNFQSALFKQYKQSSLQMMFGVSIFSTLLTLTSLIQRAILMECIIFLATHSEFAMHSLILSICSAIGQLFIFYTIQEFGPFIFTIIMTLRQAISILLSCIIYGHDVTIQGLIGIVLVFVAIGFRIYCTRIYSKKSSSSS